MIISMSPPTERPIANFVVEPELELAEAVL